MDQANPLIIVFLFVIRCLVPLLIMLGISYVLRRLGWIKDPPPPPPVNGEEESTANHSGGLAHGRP